MKSDVPADLMDLLNDVLMAALEWLIEFLIDIRCGIAPCDF